MHLHILGICGTFMGSLAQLAKSLGHRVTGADRNVYPPMSTQLSAAGIELIEGWDPKQLDDVPDLLIVGNVVSRGNPVIEAALNRGLPYMSGPQWLSHHVLQDKWVLAVAGTHGKTTTSSMLAWILDYAGMSPGFLIGGVPSNFPVSARLGESDFFVIEADEYDTAFFDKRSKFVHYHPRTLILNNLEFDHADIFPDLAAIQTQFHHLLRTLPEQGLIIQPEGDAALDAVREKGCWTPVQSLALESDADWTALLTQPDGSAFSVLFQNQTLAKVVWSLSGRHNVSNALAAVAAARHVGVAPELASQALGKFTGVKRRMECLARIGNIAIYDDFAHHPTAIASTLAGVRAQDNEQHIISVLELCSNTMRMGFHKQQLRSAVAEADQAFWFDPGTLEWPLGEWVDGPHSESIQGFDRLLKRVVQSCLAVDKNQKVVLVVMSNGGFQNFHQRLIEQLKQGH